VAESLRRHALDVGDAPGAQRALETVRADVLEELADVAGRLGGEPAAAIEEHLLFTVVGAVVGASAAFVFALGDGVAAGNGAAVALAFPGNAPPYLAYGLGAGAAAPRFRLLRLLPVDALQTLLLGTDGAVALMQAAERRLPGREERVGPLRQYWED